MKGPLWRATLVVLGERGYLLMLTIHHIVCDGWSLGCIRRELGPCYAAALRNAAPELPPLVLRYVDYAQWQRERLNDDRVEAQLAYWREQLADLPFALELPTDRPRPPIFSYRGAYVSF